MNNNQMTAKVMRVYGIVQAVGFRPTVSRHAMAVGVTGSVCNMGPFVEIKGYGTEAQVSEFFRRIVEEPPKRAVILKADVEELIPESEEIFKEIPGEFLIIESGNKKGEIFVSPDIAICPECKIELYDKKNPRYLHPFINCTCCGPRLTILEAMPYDRERTSMKEFPMCDFCEEEYHDPATRRYDAQPVCCNECGPSVYLIGEEERGREAITKVRKAIMDGKIAAIKGIGGFHLCCDAANEEAVQLLRTRKTRPAKPFAVMARDLETAKRECEVPESIEEILDGHQKPILLLNRKEGGRICEGVAPGNPKIGTMLPYAPLQLLLFDYDDDVEMTDVLVMTSANTKGAPICRDDEDAIRELTHLCDHILSHNRDILIRADDTVMDLYDNEPYMIRRSRGYAPLPVMLGNERKGCVLAIGGELKNTFCIGKDNLLYPSPYIGDMTDLRTVDALRTSVKRMEELLFAKPQIIACDKHPLYNTRMVAEELAGEREIPLLYVQHHYAHVLSCMAENDMTERVIGVSFDGTGWGDDDTIWGGEILLSDLDGYERVGSIEPFNHVGGDIAAVEGWRIAASVIHDLYGDNESEEELNDIDVITGLGLCDVSAYQVIAKMSDRRINTITSTSMGRIFDAASAILGICRKSTYEGEASCALEYAAHAFARESGEKEVYVPVFPVRKEERYLLPVKQILGWVVWQALSGEDPGKISYCFHAAIAHRLCAVCKEIRKDTGVNIAALTGGVYQNKLLLHLSKNALEREGFRVITHHLIPPNDGGIGLGQAYKAVHELKKENELCV